MELLKLLVRIVIAFLWIYQFILVDCKVIKHESALNETVTEVNHDDANKWHFGSNLQETSIRKTNSTSPRSINSLTTHM